MTQVHEGKRSNSEEHCEASSYSWEISWISFREPRVDSRGQELCEREASHQESLDDEELSLSLSLSLSLLLRHKHYKTYIRQSTHQLINSSDHSAPSAECSQGQLQAMSLFSEAVIHGKYFNKYFESITNFDFYNWMLAFQKVQANKRAQRLRFRLTLWSLLFVLSFETNCANISSVSF